MRKCCSGCITPFACDYQKKCTIEEIRKVIMNDNREFAPSYSIRTARKSVHRQLQLSVFTGRDDFEYRKALVCALRDLWRNGVRPGHPMWETIIS